MKFNGIVNQLEHYYHRYRKQGTSNAGMDEYLKKVMVEYACPECGGARLKRARRLVTVNDRSIFDAGQMHLVELLGFLQTIKPTARQRAIADTILKEVTSRLELLIAIGALDRAIPMPSLRILQAPVLHGVSISMWVELDGDFEVDTLEAALSAAGMDVRGATLDGPNGVGMAAQSGIAIGSIARDKNDRRALWLYAVADNYRLVAENALAVARGEFLRAAK